MEDNKVEDYKVLARKYRPQTFADLVGQEVLVRTLSNAIDSNRLAHAFVLTGIRGIGKTTTARIMAKALNCIGEDGTRTTPTINPCGVCTHCVQIRDDCHIDVMEVDAASNTGVDDMRQMIETSLYKPASGRYKVYIIDEVHMLSKSAFNAMLKTLEEPPANVVFILATTELRKIPVTILSRCQRFDLRRLSMQEMVEHLARIASVENVAAENDALELIAIASEGSVRDALSLLDQAISHSDKDANGRFEVKAETLRNLLGLVDRTRLYQLLQHVMAGEAQQVLQEVQAYHEAGADMVQLVEDVMHSVHDITRVLVIPNYRFDNTYSQSEKEFLYQMAGKLNVAATSMIWQIMSKGLDEVRRSVEVLRATEMLFIRICYAAGLPNPTDLVKMLRDGDKIGNGLAVNSLTNAPTNAPVAQIIEFPKLVKNDVQASVNNFNDVLALCETHKEMILLHHLREVVSLISCENNELVIGNNSTINKEHLNKLQEMLRTHTGKNWVINIAHMQGQPTIATQEQMLKQQELQSAKNHEIVKAVLEQFADAQLIAIK
jgi:DNA polymerase III subunit gamma/tau